ncbi:MAG: NYN domain-containing protein [Hyphomicrobium sp.]|jgi:uncharacterized LabA/DUF88 family protein
MHFYKQERTVVLIDGINLYAASKALGFDIDYKRLLSFFRDTTLLVRAVYFTIVAEDNEYLAVRPLIDWLAYNGYTVITKPSKEGSDGAGRRKIRGSIDLELAVEAMRLGACVDHVVLFTGDSDFRSLISALQGSGKRVSVVSTLRTQPPVVSDELRRQADQFVDLADLQHVIGRDSFRTNSSRATID